MKILQDAPCSNKMAKEKHEVENRTFSKIKKNAKNLGMSVWVKTLQEKQK